MAVLAGAALSLQSRINGELAQRLDDGLAAAFISFSSGLAVLAVLVLIVPVWRRMLASIPRIVLTGALPWWCLLAGIGGAFFVSVQTFAVPVIGVALFTVAAVSGQTVSSLNVDRVGLGAAGVAPMTAARLAAAALAIVSVVVSVSDKFASATFSLLAVVAGVVAGAFVAVQQAFNGRVRVASGSAVAASTTNFAVGTLTLLVVLGVRALADGHAAHSWLGQPLWLYSGGLIGIVFVAVSSVAVSRLGVLVFSLCQVAGQVAGALAIDVVSPVAGERVTVATIVGAVLSGLAVAVGAGLLRRRGSSSAQARSPGSSGV